MAVERPRHRLRTYLLAYFIPLTGVPLLTLAVLFYVVVGRVLSEEINRRAGPELAAVDRNLDTIERNLVREAQLLSRNNELVDSLMSRDSVVLQPLLLNWVRSSHFESVRVYDDHGRRLSEVDNNAKTRFEKNWAEFLGPRPSRAQGPSDKDRNPASRTKPRSGGFSKANEIVDPDSTLSPAFRSFLVREESWVVHKRNPKGSVFAPGRAAWEWVVYKRVLNDDFKPAGFIEATLSFDPAKIKMLSDYQGVDIVLLDPSMRPLAASNSDIETRFTGLESTLVRMASDGSIDGDSLQIDVQDAPTQFFFTSEGDPGSEGQIWLGVGLFKGEQLQILRKVLAYVSIFVLVLGLITIVLTIRISNGITKPVTDLVEATEAIRVGQWVHPVEVDENTEIGLLVIRFNEMAKSVQITKRMLEQKLEELATAHTALTQTQDQLVQSAKLSSLGQLVAGVAHELNNPIAFIYSNMTQMKLHLGQIQAVDGLLGEMRDHVDAKNRDKIEAELERVEWNYVLKDMKDMVQSCLEGSIRVKDIVLGLRNFSRLDKGEIAPIDVNEVIRGTAKLLNTHIKNKVEIHWQLCERAEIECNPSQIHQVFMNLLSNAVQAIEDRGEIWIKTEVRAGRLLVSLRDNGQGIRKENLDKIFDPFFTTKKVGEGTGLGLSIVYGIVERHGGRIDVASRSRPDPGHGTEFRIQFPCRRLSDADLDEDIAS